MERRSSVQNQKSILGLSSSTLIIILGAVAKFALHLLTGTKYGYFADELYTIALSKHLAFGYVDLPPLVPLLAALSRMLFGESLTAWHILPALAGAVTLVFVCLITKEFGGRLFAVILSALGFLIVPVWLVVFSYLSYDSYDQLFLAVFLYVLIRFLRSENRKLWILLGGIAGIACLTKMTLLYIGPGFLVALLFSKYRKDLLSPWPWWGAALFLVLISPYLLWQAANHWPTLEYWINYGMLRLRPASVPGYAVDIFYTMNPVLLPVYAIGLWRIFRRFGETNYSFLGVMFLATLALLFGLHAKTWMLAELFIPLMAAGAVGMEEMADGRSWGKILKPSAVATMLAGGLLVAPASLPILPMESLPAYADKFEFLYNSNEVFNMTFSDSPISLALRIGWEELVSKVADVYNGLPADDRKVAGIYTNWYAPASAIDYFGPRYGLPHAVSGHLNYYLWGPGYSWEVMILLTNGIIGMDTSSMSLIFQECEWKGRVFNPYTIPINQLNIYVCRKPLLSPDEIWRKMELYR
jgi:hypothetical protein